MAFKTFTIGFALGAALSISSTSLLLYLDSRRKKTIPQEPEFTARPVEIRTDEIVDGVVGLIGNTPLIRIKSLSDALGVEILGKAEFLNPGGSVKDRVALQIISDAEEMGFLKPFTGSRIFEGTVGSTGISISMISRAKGYDTTIIIPDDVAEEKARMLNCLGASVQKVRPASIVDAKQFVNVARQFAHDFGQTELSTSSEDSTVIVSVDDSDPTAFDRPRGFFADQFENLSNHRAHFAGTGPEIWRQTNGNVNAFVSGAGTGGTLAGTGRFLKSMREEMLVVLADPSGSGLYNKVKHGVMFDPKESEGSRRRHQVDTVVEGIGLNRLTENINIALPIIDDAFRITDAEAVNMSRYLVQHDGLFLGSSSACNLVAAVRLALQEGWKNGETIVTILCDSGHRHYSKFWNDEYLSKADIPIDTEIIERMLRARQ